MLLRSERLSFVLKMISNGIKGELTEKKISTRLFVYFMMQEHSLNQILDMGLVSVLKANILTSH